MKWYHVIVPVLALAGSAWGQADSFRILRTESIFSRNRVAGDGRRGGDPSGKTVAPERTPVLVGVLQDDGGYVGFLNVFSAGGQKTVQVWIGDVILWDGSLVKKIGLEGMDIERGGKGARVTTGNNLLNEPEGGAAIKPLNSGRAPRVIGTRAP